MFNNIDFVELAMGALILTITLGLIVSLTLGSLIVLGVINV